MTGRQYNNSIRPKASRSSTAVVYTREHSQLHNVTTGTATAGTYSLQAVALFDGRTEGDAPRTRIHGLWCGDVSDTSLLHGPRNSAFCPHSVLMCFVWISGHTAIISLYNIN